MDERDYDRAIALLYLCNSTKQVHITNLMQGAKQGSTLLELAFAYDRGETLVDMCAYCLMPNHFHICVRERVENGISQFMQKFGNAYTGYFNERYKRSGVLFQGKYRATHLDTDIYLKYFISYLHLNPIKLIEPKWKEFGIANRARAEKFLVGYHYSSFFDYLGTQRPESCIINKDTLPKYFETPKDFKTSVTEWLTYKNKE